MSEEDRRVALYPGTFDPITNGHLDLVRRATKLFDTVIVAVADSKRKRPLINLKTRSRLIEGAMNDLPSVQVLPFSGLLANEYEKLGINCVIKGLRSVTDFEYEFQQAQANRRLQPLFETMFFMPSDRNTCISSSLVREIHAMGGDVSSFVPTNVAKHLDQLRSNLGHEPNGEL